MYTQKQPSRQIPGILNYIAFFSSKKLAYSIFFCTPVALGVISLLLNSMFIGTIDFFHFIRFTLLFLITSGVGIIFAISFYSLELTLGTPCLNSYGL